MAFQTPNASNYLGAESPHYLSIAHNTYGRYFAANASDTTHIGVYLVKAPQGKADVSIQTDDAYASGESMVFGLEYTDAAGARQTISLGTANDVNITSATTIEVKGIDISALPIGSPIALTRAYTAGGTPTDPAVTLTAQLY